MARPVYNVTPTQIAEFMYGQVRKTGVMPTNQVVQDHFGITYPVLVNRMEWLYKSGMIEKERRRGIKNGTLVFKQSPLNGRMLKRPVGSTRSA